MTALRTPGMNFSGFCLSPNTFMVWVTTMGICRNNTINDIHSKKTRSLWQPHFASNCSYLSPCKYFGKRLQIPLPRLCLRSKGYRCCICHIQRRRLLAIGQVKHERWELSSLEHRIMLNTILLVVVFYLLEQARILRQLRSKRTCQGLAGTFWRTRGG